MSENESVNDLAANLGTEFTAATKVDDPPAVAAGAVAAAAADPPAAAAPAANCTRYFKSDDEHKGEVYAKLGKGLTRCHGTTVIYDKSKCYRRQCTATVRTDIDTYRSKLSSQEIVNLLTRENMDLKQNDADDIAEEETYFICFRHKQELSKIPYPYVQKAAKQGESIVIDHLQDIMATIDVFKWSNVKDDGELKEMLEILKNRMTLIIDHIRASSETSTEESKEELRAKLILIKDSLKRKFTEMNNNVDGLQDVWKKRKFQLDGIMELSAKSLGSDDDL